MDTWTIFRIILFQQSLAQFFFTLGINIGLLLKIKIFLKLLFNFHISKEVKNELLNFRYMLSHWAKLFNAIKVAINIARGYRYLKMYAKINKMQLKSKKLLFFY